MFRAARRLRRKTPSAEIVKRRNSRARKKNEKRKPDAEDDARDRIPKRTVCLV